MFWARYSIFKKQILLFDKWHFLQTVYFQPFNRYFASNDNAVCFFGQRRKSGLKIYVTQHIFRENPTEEEDFLSLFFSKKVAE